MHSAQIFVLGWPESNKQGPVLSQMHYQASYRALCCICPCLSHHSHSSNMLVCVY